MKTYLEVPGLRPCEECQGQQWFLGTLRASNGQLRHPYICGLCGKRTVRFAKKTLFEATPENMKSRRVIDLTRREPCEVCQSTEGVEDHHWAPYAIFGTESDRWPTSWLCVRCHLRWHQLMGAPVTAC